MCPSKDCGGENTQQERLCFIQVSLQGGHEIQEACGTVLNFETEEVEGGESSGKRGMIFP